jgi:hypothetical protein
MTNQVPHVTQIISYKRHIDAGCLTISRYLLPFHCRG